MKLPRLNLGKSDKEVMLLNTEDYRFTSLEVERETESVIYCKKHDGVIYRFFKLGPGWTGPNTRFLAVEGTPLVSYIQEDKTKVVDVKPEEALRAIMGEEGYDGLPDLLKEKIRDPNLGITVTVKPIIPDDKTQSKFDELKAEGVLYDADLDNLAKLGTAKVIQKAIDKAFENIPWLLAGMGLTYILMGMDVLKGF